MTHEATGELSAEGMRMVDDPNTEPWLRELLRRRRDFERPQSGILGWFTRRLPPAPSAHHKLKANWSTVRDYTNIPLVLSAVVMLASVLAAIQLMYHALPVLLISPLRVALVLVEDLFTWNFHWHDFVPVASSSLLWTPSPHSALALLWEIPATLLLLAGAFWFLRLIPELALSEEQTFREGAESWTFGQRVKASVLFGFAHVGNLFYPVASLLALSVGGGLFMVAYLLGRRRTGHNRDGVYRATALHALYNAVAVVVMVAYLLYMIWFL
jgi:hypothetical protein